jgi:hypothetical protein
MLRIDAAIPVANSQPDDYRNMSLLYSSEASGWENASIATHL